MISFRKNADNEFRGNNFLSKCGINKIEESEKPDKSP